jgi:hypothetical protein
VADSKYDKRVTRAVMDMAEQELGGRPPYPRVLAIVRGYMDAPGRPHKREEFAAWVFEREREALRP